MHTLMHFFSQAINTLYTNLPTTVDELLQRSSDFESTKADLLVELNSFCTNSNGLVNGREPSDIVTDVKTALQDVGDLNIDQDWSNISTMSLDAKELGDNFMDAFDFARSPFVIWFLTTTIGISVLILLIIFMLRCAWKSGQEGYEFVGDEKSSPCSKFQHYFATPLFALLVAGAWFLSSCYLALSTANAGEKGGHMFIILSLFQC